MVRNLGSDRQPLDPVRVAGSAGAVIVNAALFLLLMVPLAPPIGLPEPDHEVIVIESPRPRMVPPPVVPVRSARVPRPSTVPVKSEPVRPVQLPVVEPRPGDLPADPGEVEPDPGPAVEPARDAGGPLQGAHLAYRHAPPPPYPPAALRQGLRGTVVLRVTVEADGTPVEAVVERSSGHRVLDIAARRHVLAHWRFEPAMYAGAPVRAIGRVPIDFVLER